MTRGCNLKMSVWKAFLGLILMLAFSGCGDRLDKLLSEQKYPEAEAYCGEQSGDDQQTCFQRLADSLLVRREFTRAFRAYEQAGLKQEGAEKIAEILFAGEKFKSARHFYEVAALPEKIAACNRQMLAGLEKLKDGSLLGEALPEKYGFCLSDQTLAANVEAGGIRTYNLYSGAADTLLAWKDAVYKNLHLIDYDLKLLGSLGDNIFMTAPVVDSLSISPSGQSAPLNVLAIDPRQQWLAGGSWNDTIRCQDLNNRELSQVFAGHQAAVAWLDFSAEGNRLVSGSLDGTLKVWDMNTGNEICSASHGAPLNQVAISPDGQQAVSCARDPQIKIWDAVSGSLLKTLEGHRSYVTCVRISSDGRQLISGDFDGKIRIWQLPSGKLLRQFAAHPSAIAAIRIAPNAGYFISSGFDFKVKFWWLEDKDTFLKQFRG